ncbi:MAG: SDR family NAD(P)-dependent oxidoreductase [Bacteroidota bacterium]
MELFHRVKYAIVTGASSGIGRDIAREYARLDGWMVFAVARRADLLESLAAEFPKGRITPVCLDVSVYDNSSLLDVLTKLGVSHIDVLIGNAGMLVNRPFEEISIQEWESIYRSNVIGPAIFVRDLLPFLGQGRVSHIVNISSMGGLTGTVKFPGLAAYSSSKGAWSVLTEVLAEEFKNKNLVFNGLALGSVATEMLGKAFPGFQASVTAAEMGRYICQFGVDGWRFYRGKVLPVSNSTP